jgi:hypothetical protein
MAHSHGGVGGGLLDGAGYPMTDAHASPTPTERIDEIGRTASGIGQGCADTQLITCADPDCGICRHADDQARYWIKACTLQRFIEDVLALLPYARLGAMVVESRESLRCSIFNGLRAPAKMPKGLCDCYSCEIAAAAERIKADE